jgi:hypothetical protein
MRAFSHRGRWRQLGFEPGANAGASSAHGFQRGHRAPLASFKGPDAARELNYLSNITPQTVNLNAGPWARLEEDGVTTCVAGRRSGYGRASLRNTNAIIAPS